MQKIWVIRITMCLVLPVAVLVRAGQNNSLFLRGEQMVQDRALRGGQGQNGLLNGTRETLDPAGYKRSIVSHNITSVVKANWYAVEEPTPKDFRVHDLISIVIQETSKHYVRAKADAKRDSSIEAKLEEWIRLTKGNLRPDVQGGGDPSIKASGKREFKGESKINREDSLSARIQAQIIDVLPNGNLVLEATHMVAADDETLKITLTGVCRSKDVGVDNSIVSSKIAGLEIRKSHTGMARDATKRGFLQALLDFLNPF